MTEEKEIRFLAKVNKQKIMKHMEERGLKPSCSYIKDVYFDDENYSLLKSEKGFRWRTKNFKKTHS